MYFKALVTSYFVDLIIITKHTLTTYIHFDHLKIADLQAHNASQCDALWACRSAIFKYFIHLKACEMAHSAEMSTFYFWTFSTFWYRYFPPFTQVHFEFKTFTCRATAKPKSCVSGFSDSVNAKSMKRHGFTVMKWTTWSTENPRIPRAQNSPPRCHFPTPLSNGLSRRRSVSLLSQFSSHFLVQGSNLLCDYVVLCYSIYLSLFCHLQVTSLSFIESLWSRADRRL